MSKQKKIEDNMSPEDLAMLREAEQLGGEIKTLAKEIKAESYMEDMVKPANQSQNDNVQKMGHTHEKHCDIL